MACSSFINVGATNKERSLRYPLTETQSDITRLRKEYADRSKRGKNAGYYSFHNLSNLFLYQQRERDLLSLLKYGNLENLEDETILEIGCGSGGVLMDFIKYGVVPNKVSGVDLLFDRLQKSKSRLGSSKFVNSDGQYLPYPSRSFDIILQFTAFSSILDLRVKQNMAEEMLRVLKDKGAIIWYDFWWNPTNPQTSGIKPYEIKQLFPNCFYSFRKVTLAPPISRRIVQISWPIALILESLKIFNSHYLALIKKR